MAGRIGLTGLLQKIAHPGVRTGVELGAFTSLAYIRRAAHATCSNFSEIAL